MSGFMQEFRDFAVKGNVVDMAVGIIIGGAFTLIVKSLVGDMLNPLIGLLIGGVDFSNFFIVLKEGAQAAPYASLDAAKEAGAVTLNYGLFINAIISFALVALAVFVLIRQINKLKKEAEEAPEEITDKDCPYCLSKVPLAATRCSHCTSELAPAAPVEAA
ncbi:large conductance mechanosensitive channel protein MscL [Cobetia sp. cqz5-12]|uniref:large conductance mechanosensitive channel protein MscL n=1 Tax=Cobetia sp. cqz5-12 TaxID=2609415 RepID=UPI001906A36D|nr:large conductance mechanosensitive channel protein MscL [Cobetia sp. cqz5-12]QQK64410.1 large conductance mechanosensitive channel protein MscL [Cobetia sp. cqz5-12]